MGLSVLGTPICRYIRWLAACVGACARDRENLLSLFRSSKEVPHNGTFASARESRCCLVWTRRVRMPFSSDERPIWPSYRRSRTHERLAVNLFTHSQKEKKKLASSGRHSNAAARACVARSSRQLFYFLFFSRWSGLGHAIDTLPQCGFRYAGAG